MILNLILTYMKSTLETLINRIVFRHQSADFYPELKPVAYTEIAKHRESDEYMKDRIEGEKVYHTILGDNTPDQSFLYATVVGFHKMDNPLDYPGYTYYFRLTPEQIQDTIFHVVYGKGSTKPMKGIIGLILALKLWKKHKARFKSYDDPLIGQIDPRIEVVISYPVKYFKYVPQVEDRASK